MLEQAPENDITKFEEFRKLCRLLADQGIRSENYDSVNAATWQYALFKDGVDNQELSEAASALASYKTALTKAAQDITDRGQMSNSVKPIVMQLQTLAEQVSTAFTESYKQRSKLK